MAELNKIVTRQDANFKLSPSTSNETSINLSNEIYAFIADQSGDITFKLYRNDFIKAIGALCLIPKVFNKKNQEPSNPYDIFTSLFSEVQAQFGDHDTSFYTIYLFKRDDGRAYCNNLKASNGFNLRSFLVEQFSILHFQKNDNDELTIRLDTILPEEIVERKCIQIQSDVLNISPRQIIYYGAPGTGKSYKIKGLVKEGNHVRTTFHPDSDYASFVGAYKPTMSESSKHIYSKSELIGILNQFKTAGLTYPCQKFGSDYWYSLQDMSSTDIKEIINSCGFTEPYYQEINKGIAIGKYYYERGLTDRKIVYEFVAQAFLQTYTEAWKRSVGIMTDKEGINVQMPEGMDDKYYLVIEEINRGNCAQIFGDLFQLLDRDDNGESSYAIRPDQDIKRFLAEQFQGIEGLPEAIRRGEEMKLPSNLYIFATMNTSDQSLFPIDSAFKRRWDWEYVPIKDEKKGYYIKVGDSAYLWSDFLDKINETILRVTQSDDKQMGYWFVHLPEGQKEISTDKFVGKVLFYLWNDVFKDFGDGEDTIFIGEKEDSSKYELRFKDFFSKERDEHIKNFMRKNKVEGHPIESFANNEIAEEDVEDILEENTNNVGSDSSDLGDWRFAFWQKVKNRYGECGYDFTANVTNRKYYQMITSVRDLKFINSLNKRDGICWVGLYIEVKSAAKVYNQLLKFKNEIKLPFELSWIPNDAEHGYASIRATKEGYNFDNEDDYNDAVDWFANTGAQIFNAFTPYLVNLQ